MEPGMSREVLVQAIHCIPSTLPQPSPRCLIEHLVEIVLDFSFDGASCHPLTSWSFYWKTRFESRHVAARMFHLAYQRVWILVQRSLQTKTVDGRSDSLPVFQVNLVESHPVFEGDDDKSNGGGGLRALHVFYVLALTLQVLTRKTIEGLIPKVLP